MENDIFLNNLIMKEAILNGNMIYINENKEQFRQYILNMDQDTEDQIYNDLEFQHIPLLQLVNSIRRSPNMSHHLGSASAMQIVFDKNKESIKIICDLYDPESVSELLRTCLWYSDDDTFTFTFDYFILKNVKHLESFKLF